MIIRKHSVILLVLLAVLVLAACGGGDEEKSPPAVQLQIGDQVYTEAAYSYCWPQSADNWDCDVNSVARDVELLGDLCTLAVLHIPQTGLDVLVEALGSPELFEGHVLFLLVATNCLHGCDPDVLRVVIMRGDSSVTRNPVTDLVDELAVLLFNEFQLFVVHGFYYSTLVVVCQSESSLIISVIVVRIEGVQNCFQLPS